MIKSLKSEKMFESKLYSFEEIKLLQSTILLLLRRFHQECQAALSINGLIFLSMCEWRTGKTLYRTHSAPPRYMFPHHGCSQLRIIQGWPTASGTQI